RAKLVTGVQTCALPISGVTVILATSLGFPISTTHGILGAMIGAGLMASGSQVNFHALSKTFVLPLVLSPALAVALAALLYVVFRSEERRVGKGCGLAVG